MQAIQITSSINHVVPAANASCFQQDQFGQQLLALRPNVLRFCQHYLKDSELAQEVCQDTMLKAFKNVGQFEQRSNLKTWLLKIAFNECTTQYRKIKIHAHRFTEFDEADFEQDGENNAFEEDQDNPRLAQIVSSLSATQQTILRYRFVDDLALVEIASLMDAKLSSVKMNYYRALDKINKLYVS